MPRRIVIVGAVALGPKVACRIRRLDPDAQITMVDRDSRISYAGCGIPYFVAGDVPEVEGLLATAYKVKRDPDFFRRAKAVEVRAETEALQIDRAGKRVRIRDLKTASEEWLTYDKLVLATGSRPWVPPIPGRELPGVTAMSNLHDALLMKKRLSKGEVRAVVIIGAGGIGLEMAEALTELWGVEVTILEIQDQVLPSALSPELARLVQDAFARHEVKFLTGERAERLEGDPETGVSAVVTASGQRLPCQHVIMATGVRPNADLAREAGLAIGRLGGIVVDARLRTSDPDIYAGGDCVELRHLVSGEATFQPLGSLANRQGRVIAANLAGGRASFPGALGSFCVKAFDVCAARAGLSEAEAVAAGFPAVAVLVAAHDRAHYYPTAKMMFLKLIADRATRRVLGVEAVGEAGDAVKSRVDAIAAAMTFGADLEAVSNLEVAYAPPYAQAMDIVNLAANALENVIEGRNDPVSVGEFLREFSAGKLKVLDVRTRAEAEAHVRQYGERWLNVPSDTLRARLDELELEEPLVVLCNSGQRSYEAQIAFRQAGRPAPRHLQGGQLLLLRMDRTFLKAEEAEED